MNHLSKTLLANIIEAADEIITALAGENEDIHPENSTKMVTAWDHLNDALATPAVVKKMARLLLAGMEQDPIYQVQYGQQWKDVCQEQYDDHINHGSTVRIVYAAPPVMVAPDGWVMVPIVPTEDMVIEGFESEPDEGFSEPDVWEAYEAMSGCGQAAQRAKLCWAAMLAAAPKLEDVL